MKIAIQGHPFRGKEVIEILTSLGGKSIFAGLGFDEKYYYYINSNGMIIESLITIKTKDEFKLYTLEEFEKEFPFKVGDKVKYITSTGIIKEYCYVDNEPAYKVESMELGIIVTILVEMLEPYKEMNTRNVTLTLDKAKEWYNKGGELREIALQAFSEEELNPLPRSWEEFCKQGNPIASWRYTIPAKYEAFYKLEHLRDCWRQGWKPKMHESVYTIKFSNGGLRVYYFSSREFLSFPTKEMAEEFFECFRDLIEKAGDLI